MNRPLTQRDDDPPRTIMGDVCDVLCGIAAFALLFGMGFLALHF